MNALQVFHIVSLDDWIHVPCIPKLEGNFGQLLLEKSGQPIGLLAARVEEGLKLTVLQAKAVLKHLGASLKGLQSKAQIYQALISMVCKSQEEQDRQLQIQMRTRKRTSQNMVTSWT